MVIQTLSQLFAYNISHYNRPDLMIYRGHDGAFYKISSNEFKERVLDFAMGLKSLGVKPATKMTFLSENRPEWHIADFACHLLGVVVVPIYPTLIAEQIEYIVNDSDSELIILSNRSQADKIAQIRKKLKKVKYVIAMDSDAAAENVMSFDDVLQAGRQLDSSNFLEKSLKLAKPGIIATIIYTSGTTGLPKGVMLSHQNMVSNVLGCHEVIEIGLEDRGLSFLPLSHAFERTVDYLYFYRGASIIYSQIDNIADDLMESRPSVMASVPRFYEKIKTAVETKADSGSRIQKAIFNWSMNVGKKKAEQQLQGKKAGLFLKIEHAIADSLVFSKIRARTGGKMKYFISGGAPLAAEVGLFFYAAGLKVLEGYGLSETSPVISVNPPQSPKFGTVGKVLPGVTVKISDKGEIVVKGPNVMMGYYKMPAETEKVLVEGWFRTGDIGELDEDGYLKITDRIKQLIVTSVGKKVAPQAIEKEVENSPFIEQVMLIGEKRNFISALIVPSFEALQNHANRNGIAAEKPTDLIEHQSIINLIHSEIEERQKIFSKYERIHEFRLLPQEFTVENGMLTPTLKVKRKQVEQEYHDLIEEIYA